MTKVLIIPDLFVSEEAPKKGANERNIEEADR